MEQPERSVLVYPEMLVETRQLSYTSTAVNL